MFDGSDHRAGELVGGRYLLGRELGAGGMGVVFEAEDQLLGSTVAVKLLHADETSENAVARLQREARSAAKLGHPNIVRVLDLGRTADGAYLVMENLSGEALDQRIAREGRLPARSAVRIHVQLLSALEAAHEAAVLHRDIKPSNVFLTSLADGSELVKLLDFGLAYLLEEAASPKLTATGIAMGTPAYMAPERIQGAALDARSDLYAVGVSLYECLTGELPFFAESAMALRGRILLTDAPSLTAKRPELGDALARFLLTALEKEAKNRFQTAKEMSAALRQAARTITSMTGTADEPASAPRVIVKGAETNQGIGPPGSPERGASTDDLGTFDTMAAISQAELPPTQDHDRPAEETQRGHGSPIDTTADTHAALPTPVGKVTPPLGGVTVPHEGALSPPQTRARISAQVPTRRGIPSWLVGLSMGAAAGAVLLLGLWIWHTSQRGTTPAATVSASSPAQTTTSAVEPTAGSPAPSAPPAVEPTPEVPAAAPVVEEGIEPPEETPAEPAVPAAPAPRPRPRVRPPRPRPTPTPAATPAPRPAPRPPSSGLGAPLEPDWDSPPR